MSYIEPDVGSVIEPELSPGERILWAGRPNKSVIFHKQDAMMIPFSLFWGGFALFWEAQAMTGNGGLHAASLIFDLWGIPFVLMGQYLIWGRFIYTAWVKERAYYAVTDRRLIAILLRPHREVYTAFIDAIPLLRKEDGAKGTATLRFSEPQDRRQKGTWNAMSMSGSPAFIDIDDPDTPYRLIGDLREKSRRI